MNIRLLEEQFDVQPLAAALAANPDIWDEHPWRTAFPSSPHREVSDIWVRYSALSNLGPHFNDEHESVWYPVVERIPAAKQVAEEVARRLRAHTLGGVLITKIAPGGQVYPHVDAGWHALHYEKIGVQIAGNDAQAFCFRDAKVSAHPGQAYWFNNQAVHWVKNDSNEERITMIVCIRRIH